MYKYLLWDIDGTVLDFHASEAYAIKELFKKYNLGACTDQMLETYSKINVKYWQMLERGELTKDKVLVGRFEEFFNLIGVDSSVAPEFNRDYQLTLGDHIEFVEGAKEILDLQKGKCILAAVTNGTKVAQQKKLNLSGLFNVFDEIFISEDVGYEKPDKRFFDFVFDKLGIENKREALIIGDSLTSDIKGGVNAGIDTCWFNPAHNLNSLDIPVTYEIDELKKIYSIIGVKNENL